MLIERIIFFIIFGFFVFSPQIPGWHENQHIVSWYGYYLPGFIFLSVLGWALRPKGKPPS